MNNVCLLLARLRTMPRLLAESASAHLDESTVKDVPKDAE